MVRTAAIPPPGNGTAPAAAPAENERSTAVRPNADTGEKGAQPSAQTRTPVRKEQGMKTLLTLVPAILIMAYAAKFLHYWLDARR